MPDRFLGRRCVADKVLSDGPFGLLIGALLVGTGVWVVAWVGGRPARLALVQVLRLRRSLTIIRFPTTPSSGLSQPGWVGISTPWWEQTVRREGRVLVAGDYGGVRMEVRWNLVLHRELEILGSNVSASAWDEAVQIAQHAQILLGRLISHVFPVERYAEAFQVARRDRTGGKVVLTWETSG